jgi:type IV pilus assembly protein PilV
MAFGYTKQGFTGRQTGLSLLEVMVAIAVLSVGLLGLAQMQAFGMMNVERAYQRSQATVLAYQIADKMRAQVVNPSVTTLNLSRYLTTFMAPDEAEAQSDCMSTTGCSTDAMAENDLFEWNAALQSELPGAIGSITLADDNYTISIVWDDNGDGETDELDPSFDVSFVP